ncbi:MAG: hypothetical protein JXA42_08325 [Anaerolineales bacterium]|nr:hypothetical protein [Anaerolineales bacterium]
MTTDPTIKTKVAWLALAAFITVLSIYLGVSFPIPLPPEDLGTTHFTNIEVTDLSVTGDVTVADDLTADAITAGNDMTVTGAFTVTAANGNTVAAGDLIGGADLRLMAQTAISVTNGNPFTPTGMIQPLTSAGAVTPTIAIGSAYDLLLLINTSATTIVIQDTGTQKLSGDVALGQYDTLTLWCDGTNWIQLAASNN